MGDQLVFEIVNEAFGCLYNGYEGLDEARDIIAESVQLVTEGKKPKNTLVVQLPVGFVDKETANGNYYEKSEMDKALKKVEKAMESGLVHGTHGEHPKDRADLRPDEISHLVTKAWVEPKSKLLWNEWRIVPTIKGGGKDLMELFLAGASIGTSIRGTAVRTEGKYMKHYNFKGTDTVAVPSTGIRPGINNENLRARIMVEDFSADKPLFEGVRLMSDDTLADEIKQVSESLKSAVEGSNASGIVDLASKMGSLEGRLRVLQAESSGKDKTLSELQEKLKQLEEMKEALEREKDEAVKDSETYKKTVQDLEKQAQELEEEVDKKKHSLETASKALEEIRRRYKEKEKDAEKVDVAKATIEELREYALRAEGVIGEARDYILALEGVVEEIRDYAHGLEFDLEDAVEERDTAEDKVAVAMKILNGMKDRIKGVTKVGESVQPASMASYINHIISKNPEFKVFKEELSGCTTVAQVHHRVKKYADIIKKAGSVDLKTEDEDAGPGVKATGVERHMRGGLR